MSTTPIKSAKVRNAVKAALGLAVAAPLAFAVAPASAADVQLGETTVDIGGFIRMDMFYDFEDESGASLNPGDSIADGADKDGQFNADARFTRLTFSFTTPTAAGDIGGYIETDFQDHAGDGGGLRLRQAYVTYGNWLIGKAWTPLYNGNWGPTVDFAGTAGAGMNFGRNWQVRYTFDLGGSSNLALALEIPDDVGYGITTPTGLVSGSFTVLDPALASSLAGLGLSTSTLTSLFGSTTALTTTNPLPALTMSYSGGSDVFSYDAGLMVRDYQAQLGANEDETIGWALALGGTYTLDTGTSFKLRGTYGEGTGQYILSDTGLPDVYFDDSGDLQTTEEWAVTAAIAQQFTDTWSGAIQYSYFEGSLDTDLNADGYSDDLTGSGQAINVGLFYSPADPLTFGIGYKYVSRELKSDSGAPGVGSATVFDGDANRITFSTTYSF